MAEWWKMSSKQMAGDDESLQARHLAYFNTFLNNQDGRRVLADLRNEVMLEMSSVPAKMTASEHAVGCRYLIMFMDLIKKRLGVIDEINVIEAEATISSRYERRKQETKKDDMYDI
jgi:hypothetical protein